MSKCNHLIGVECSTDGDGVERVVSESEGLDPILADIEFSYCPLCGEKLVRDEEE